MRPSTYGESGSPERKRAGCWLLETEEEGLGAAASREVDPENEGHAGSAVGVVAHGGAVEAAPIRGVTGAGQSAGAQAEDGEVLSSTKAAWKAPKRGVCLNGRCGRTVLATLGVWLVGPNIDRVGAEGPMSVA